MSMKLYVGNLPFQVTETDLQDMFEPYGEITDVHLVLDRATHRSRGFGFVTFGDAEQGKAAIEAMNGKDCDGRSLTVNEARPMEPRGNFGGGGGGGGGKGGRRDFGNRRR